MSYMQNGLDVREVLGMTGTGIYIITTQIFTEDNLRQAEFTQNATMHFRFIRLIQHEELSCRNVF